MKHVKNKTKDSRRKVILINSIATLQAGKLVGAKVVTQIEEDIRLEAYLEVENKFTGLS
jgi:hypothetical protein